MKKLFLSIGFALFVLAPCGNAMAQQSCLSALDCPGGQLCQMGKCVAAGGAAPPTPAPAPVPGPPPGPGPAPSGGCLTDIDCPGNQVCQNGACAAGQAPPPAPSPIPGPPPASGYGPPPATTPSSSGYGAPAQPTEPAAGGTSSGFTPPADKEAMLLTKGTMQLGGILALRYEHLATSGGYSNGTKVEVQPEFGYFMIDNFELVIGLLFAKGFGEYYEVDLGDAGSIQQPMFIGGAIGIRYHIAAGSLFFYLGLDVGMQVEIYEEDGVDPYKWATVAVPIGLLIPLNAHVALDVGLKPQYHHGLDSPSLQYIGAPVGFLGVQGFF